MPDPTSSEPVDDAGLRLRAAVQALRTPETAGRAPAPVSSVFGRAAAAVPDDAQPAAQRNVLGTRMRSVETSALLPGTTLALFVVPSAQEADALVSSCGQLVAGGAVVVVLGPGLARQVSDRARALTSAVRPCHDHAPRRGGCEVGRRLQLVVNPSAGGGRAARLLPAVEAALRTAGHDLVVTPTRSLEHADELAAQAVADDRVAVAMGGDGIVGRVAGVVAATGGVMGVLPGGRGNDLCRATGLPRDAVQACAVLTTGAPRALDLGVVRSATGEVPFLGIASIGFDSEVQERVLTTRLRLGRLVYLYGSLVTVARWQPATFTATVDGRALTVHGWSFAVANSGTYGGGMRLAPAASLEDGLLDVVTTSRTSRVRFLRALPRLFSGTHVREPSVEVTTARCVELDADRPFRVFADGDPVGTLPCTISVRPGAVQVLLPVVWG